MLRVLGRILIPAPRYFRYFKQWPCFLGGLSACEESIHKKHTEKQARGEKVSALCSSAEGETVDTDCYLISNKT